MSFISRLFLGLIRVYQYLFSSFMGRSCRYHPTCSTYMSGSIRRFGAARGLFLGVKRICRCHPFHPGGYDPVPENFSIFASKKKQRCDKQMVHHEGIKNEILRS